MISPMTIEEPVSAADSPANLAKLKAAVMQIGLNGTQYGFKFAVLMFKRYPELKSA